LNGYSISDSGVIGGSYPKGSVQNFTTFQPVSSAEIGVTIHKGGKVGAWAGIFVVEWLLKEGPQKDSELML
jgi:hypothetical protein